MRISQVIILLLFLGSCTKPVNLNTRERYVVTSKNLNIRSDPSKLSRIIGTLSKGDTIAALASDKYWIMISSGNQSGFISNEFIKKIEPYKSPFPFNFVDRYSDWKTYQFWVFAFLSITLWIITALGISRYESYLRKDLGLKTKSLSLSPIVFFVAGILLGVLYLYWKDQFIEALIHKFSFNPIGKELILWALIGQLLFLVFGLTIDFLSNIFRSGFRYGTTIFLLEIIENLLILIVTFYLTVSLFLIAIIILTLFFAMQYITMVSENSTTFSEIIFKK